MTPRVPSLNTLALKVMLTQQHEWLKMQLPPTAAAAVIGWIQQAPSHEAGVAPEIVHLLSRALTRSSRVTFLDDENGASEAWTEHGDCWVGRVRAAGWKGMLRSKDLLLTSTVAPEVAAGLFEASAGGWSREAQLVLLSAVSGSVPGIDADTLDELLRGRLEDGASGAVACLSGFMLPGPDGDFAQMVFLRRESLSTFLTHLQDEAAAAGIGFEIITPEAFAQTNWYVEKVEKSLWR